jgi:hypothetical protein
VLVTKATQDRYGTGSVLLPIALIFNDHVILT